jgi:cysteinyl-tRNA synthetase
VHELARSRQAARAAKEFARADELRAEIEAAGWDVRDDPGGYRLVPR